MKWLRNKLSATLITIGWLTIGLTLTACNEDASNSSSSSADGEIIIGLTDAPGDFVSYTVDVVSLTMTKADGTIVETMPLTTRVDFALYTDMTEFLTAATVPAGVYTKATMKIDYQNADIWVENANGDSVKVENIVDVANNPLTTMEVAVHLDGRNKLLIAPGIPAHLTLDFDLNASNQIVFDPDSGEPTQTVEPFLLADVNLEKSKVHRLRGPLANVNVDKGSFKVIIRPFHHAVVNDSRFGALNVLSTSATVFEIDQQNFLGQDGILALDNMPKFSAVVVIGDLKPKLHQFIATEVYAGSSVPGGTLDVVKGTVISRDETTLTVKGATLIRAAGSVVFNDTVNVLIGDSTLYKKQFSMESFQNHDVSVGQLVTIFGALPSPSSTVIEMDANQGLVRMQLSTLRGTALAGMDNNAAAPLVMDLQRINLRHFAIFDFAGTGIDAANDADPMNYEIDKGSLDLSGIADNAPLKVRGFVTPWGTAPNDFDAYTIVDLTFVKAALAVNWVPATSIPFVDMSPESVTVNLDGTGLFHHISRGGVTSDLSNFSTPAIIKPSGDGDGLYVIVEDNVVQLHTTFANFIADIEARLGEGKVVANIVAAGNFDQNAVSLTSHRVRAKMVSQNTIQ